MGRLDELPVQVRGVATDGEVEARGKALPQLGEAAVEVADGLDLRGERAHARDQPDGRERGRRHQPVERCRPAGLAEGTPRQRLDQAGDRVEIRPPELLHERPRRRRDAQPQRRVDRAVERAKQHLADALPSPLGGHHQVGGPPGAPLAARRLQRHGHARLLGDDGGALPREEDQRTFGRRARVEDVLPRPPQLCGVGGVVPEDAPHQGIHAPAITGVVPDDVGHGVRRSCHCNRCAGRSGPSFATRDSVQPRRVCRTMGAWRRRRCR